MADIIDITARGETVNAEGLNPVHHTGSNPAAPTTTTTEMPPANGFNFDALAAFNIRQWLREACEAKGAKFTGGGVGFGGADLDIEIDGCAFNIFVKPIMR